MHLQCHHYPPPPRLPESVISLDEPRLAISINGLLDVAACYMER